MKRADMRKHKMWNWCRLWGFLLIGILLAGCGKEQEAESGSFGGEVSSSVQQTGLEALYAQYCSVSMDSARLAVNDKVSAGVLGQLIKMKCLAAKGGIYVAGSRLNHGEAELAVYQIGMDRTPRLALSYPGEVLVAWSASGEEIALLCMRGGNGEGSDSVQYSLHSLLLEEEGGLKETDVWTLTEELGQANIDGMIAEEGRLTFWDGGGRGMTMIDLTSGEAGLSVSMTENVVAAAYGKEDEVLILTAEGNLYSYSFLTGGREIRGERLFDQIKGRGHYAIGNSEIYVGGNLSLYGVRISGGEEKRLLDYDPGMKMSSSLWIDEGAGEGSAVCWDEESRQVFCYFLSAVPVPDAREGRSIVTLENYRVDDELKAAAADFNQISDKYWVEIVEAKEDENASDYDTGFKTRLMAKQGPDLLLAAEGFEFSDYVRQGLLEDLSVYIQRDLQPENYVKSAMDAYERDGGIYALGSGFGLEVLMLDGEMTDSAKGFDLRSISQIMEEAKLSVFMPNMERDRLLAFCLVRLDGDFREENVRECILFAEKYGSDHENYSETFEVGKEVMAEWERIDTPLDIPDLQAYYGDGIVMIGNIMGHEEEFEILFSPGALSVNSASENKEGAWEFIKFMLGEEYQFSMKDKLPMRKDAFDAMLASYQQPRTFDIYIEESNEIVTVSSMYYPKRLSKTGMGNGIDAVTQEQTKLLREMVEKGVAGSAGREFGAETIIYEEVSAYFEGKRSLDQVMEIIMNRLGLYLEERR